MGQMEDTYNRSEKTIPTQRKFNDLEKLLCGMDSSRHTR